ncbi:MAG: LPS export ABC transporter periplasmic protein LptC [Candidatus Omnitrophica bacterium]|nr:LPS export ABC transporter periplasmic protein LptC [Candidatus Omnitrophota bacterium]
MFLRSLILVTILLSSVAINIQAYPEQKIKDFYLSNFKDDGSQDWELKGEDATIHDNYVDIDNMEANYYTKNDTILITSDEARLNKENMDVYLQDSVHIENEEGATLETNSLSWQKENNYIETDDWVKTTRDSMEIEAVGLSADTQLKTAAFKKDVKVTLPDQESKEVTIAVCSGPLEIEYNEGKATFNENVVVTNPKGKLYSDKATLFFDIENKEIVKIVSEGNVKIVQGSNVTFSQKATYLGKEQKIILEGRPRVVYYPDNEGDLDLFR